MRYFILFNGKYVEANWVVWLRFQYCTNPNLHNLTLLAFGAELLDSPALFMRPPSDYCIPCPAPLHSLDFTHNYRSDLPSHLRRAACKRR